MSSYKIITKFNKFSLNQNSINPKHFNTFNDLLICTLKFNKHHIDHFGYYSNNILNKEFHLNLTTNHEISFTEIDDFRKEFIKKYDMYISMDFLVRNDETLFEENYNNDIFLL